MASVVIKVKYEETLRRFNVAINGDWCLDLSIEGLKLKICSLFNLPSDSQFRLTYKDEDDDLVTLVDDDDLHDIVTQGLDPVRISVHLISDQRPQSSKVGVSQKNATLSNSNVGNDTKGSSDSRKHEGVKRDNFPSSWWSKSARGIENNDNFALQRDYVNRAAGFLSLYPVPAYDQSFKLIHPPNRNSNKTDDTTSDTTSIVHIGITCDGCGLRPITGPRFKSKVRYNYDLCRGCFLHIGNEMDYCRMDLPFRNNPPQSVKFPNAFNIGTTIHNGITCNGCGLVPICGPRFKSKVKYNYDLCNICFLQSGNFLDYAMIEVPLTYHHYDRAPDVDRLGVVIHNGVFCNGCGAFPIEGQRFMSKVRHDYDLCSSCIVWMNRNDKDYIRISRLDSPLADQYLQPVRLPDVKSPCTYTAVSWNYPVHSVLKLDSCFIKHVSIPNGTTMAPLTPFTKIWRVLNTGTLHWFRGLHLIWVGGDRFSPSDSVEIEVTAFGVGIGQELNIAVGFVAPELPGQYTSSWRMVSLSGQPFGQQVSVQIQVDPSVDLTREVFRSLDLNLPPISSKTVFPEVANVKAEPGLDINVTNSSAPSIVDQNRKIQMFPLNLEINDDLPPAAANSNGTETPVGPSSVSYPKTDASSYSIPEASTPVQSDPISDNDGEFLAASIDAVNLDNNGTLDKNMHLEQVHEKTETEEKLQKELEQIGFKQIEVDSEQSVDYLSDDSDEEVDSEQSVDDLSDDSDYSDDWDPILEELTEMGFEDKDKNKQLLEKNNGRITRVVMDLIAAEKA